MVAGNDSCLLLGGQLFHFHSLLPHPAVLPPQQENAHQRDEKQSAADPEQKLQKRRILKNTVEHRLIKCSKQRSKSNKHVFLRFDEKLTPRRESVMGDKYQEIASAGTGATTDASSSSASAKTAAGGGGGLGVATSVMRCWMSW